MRDSHLEQEERKALSFCPWCTDSCLLHSTPAWLSWRKALQDAKRVKKVPGRRKGKKRSKMKETWGPRKEVGNTCPRTMNCTQPSSKGQFRKSTSEKVYISKDTRHWLDNFVVSRFQNFRFSHMLTWPIYIIYLRNNNFSLFIEEKILKHHKEYFQSF